MKQVLRRKKWTSYVILTSTLDDVRKLCENPRNGFANPSQFIHFVIRKELDRRKTK